MFECRLESHESPVRFLGFKLGVELKEDRSDIGALHNCELQPDQADDHDEHGHKVGSDCLFAMHVCNQKTNNRNDWRDDLQDCQVTAHGEHNESL